MLRLRSCVFAQVLSSPSVSPLHRLLSAAAPAISPNPSFAVEEYLVSTCGLTRPQAVKASAKLSHLKSPANADAVLAFLAGLGLSGADVAAVVARDPQFLCASVERTLAPVVVGLSGLGLSRSDISRLAFLAVHKFRQKSVVSKLHYYLRLFGTSHNFLRVMKFSNILSYNLERVVKPNLALLQGCGLGDCDIAKLCISKPRLLTNNPKRVQAIVTCAQNIGVPRGSRMFRHALHAVAFFREEEIAARMEYLRNTFRWTAAEVGMAVSKAPMVLTRAKESLQRTSEFLISEVGLEPAYIARRPTLLTFSLKGWLRARHYVVKFLKENGLLGRNRDYYSVVNITEKVFVEKFICPHKEVAPHLAEDYAAACKDEVPTRFRFI